MKQAVSRLLLPACVALLATACTDDKYDLSDLDKTAQIAVNDLVLPLNFDAVTLDDVIDIKDEETSKLKIIDGQYVFVVDGEFHSSEISVKGIDIEGPVLEDERDPLYFAGTAPDGAFNYPIVTEGTDFTYNDGNVTDDIVDLFSIETSLQLTIRVGVEELIGRMPSMTFTDLKVQLPTDMKATSSHGTYDPATGILSIPSASIDGDWLTINVDINNIKLGLDAIFDYARHDFTFSGIIRLTAGTLSLHPSTFGTAPSTIYLVTKYDLGMLTVKTVTGVVQHSIDMNIEPFDLTDIPDFVAGSETNLELQNPQLYLSFNNPVSSYGLTSQTNLSLTPVREDEEGVSIAGSPVTYPGTLIIEKTPTTGYDLFGLEPIASEAFPSVIGKAYPGLRELLAGSGIPSKIEVDAYNTRMPAQAVSNFRVGESLGTVNGQYQFFAPLAFGPNSRIIYSETRDGWSDEDLEKITIEKLEVTTTATNNTPLHLLVKAHPIDKAGNQIGDVQLEGAEIAPGETKELKLYTTGTITGLDGMRFTAEMSNNDDKTLRPDDNLVLEHVRVRVTGYYTTEL